MFLFYLHLISNLLHCLFSIWDSSLLIMGVISSFLKIHYTTDESVSHWLLVVFQVHYLAFLTINSSALARDCSHELVANITSNSVIIFDKMGHFEWLSRMGIFLELKGKAQRPLRTYLPCAHHMVSLQVFLEPYMSLYLGKM